MLHPDLEALYKLALTDAELAAIDRDESEANRRLTAARKAVTDAEASIAELKGRVDELKRRQHELQRKLDQYETRRRGALRALETGSGSADAAQRQLDQCTAILDDLETEQLEGMEAQDGLEEERSKADQALQEARDALAAREESTPAALAEIAGRRSDALGRRGGIVGGLGADRVKRYDTVKARRGTAVAMLQRGACKTCGTVAPKQQVADIMRGLMPPCKRCGRWLMPEERPED